ncbi:MAG: HindVP family restriction endonuclease [Candidatus Poribacteria bacterium]|nr:HindVP family restriction endonuclease [Candidatus Poribacteria bacterium]MDE0469756.1 HindVP family restriction endonuclease [Candidatus Poribacteria bacterium]
MDSAPALFGLNQSNTNKDFSQAKAWGKNSFNNCFPIALLCYMQSQKIAPVYLALDGNWNVIPEKIDVNSVFGHAYDSEDIYFAFEYTYGQNQQFVKGTLPRIDLVVMDNSNSESPWLRALEIKLTALPDNSTCGFSEEEYGCELVVRPNTIIHLTLEIVSQYAEHRTELLGSLSPIFQNNFDWESEDSMLEKIPHITQTIKTLLLAKIDDQTPLVIQPIWKTIGKSSRLHENCLDVFVWSTFAFTKLLLDTVEQGRAREFSRAKRAVLWIVKMLSDFATDGKIDPQTVSVGFTRQTDKAFALSGRKTHPYMSCAELLRPRIRKTQIKNIILGQGEKLLSPERRFDAILVNSPELFT